MVRGRQAAFGEVFRPLPYPQSARLLPRLACALNMRLFVHFVQAAQAPPALALRSKNDVSKIVQNCAFLRKMNNAIIIHASPLNIIFDTR
nr:MAG TPA: hypothetical protein [Caudoviricetes sp.]